VHAATSANVDAIMIGLANLTITLSLGGLASAALLVRERRAPVLARRHAEPGLI
jgi:hypothetical protein